MYLSLLLVFLICWFLILWLPFGEMKIYIKLYRSRLHQFTEQGRYSCLQSQQLMLAYIPLHLTAWCPALLAVVHFVVQFLALGPLTCGWGSWNARPGKWQTNSHFYVFFYIIQPTGCNIINKFELSWVELFTRMSFVCYLVILFMWNVEWVHCFVLSGSKRDDRVAV